MNTHGEAEVKVKSIIMTGALAFALGLAAPQLSHAQGATPSSGGGSSQVGNGNGVPSSPRTQGTTDRAGQTPQVPSGNDQQPTGSVGVDPRAGQGTNSGEEKREPTPTRRAIRRVTIAARRSIATPARPRTRSIRTVSLTRRRTIRTTRRRAPARARRAPERSGPRVARRTSPARRRARRDPDRARPQARAVPAHRDRPAVQARRDRVRPVRVAAVRLAAVRAGVDRRRGPAARRRPESSRGSRFRKGRFSAGLSCVRGRYWGCDTRSV